VPIANHQDYHPYLNEIAGELVQYTRECTGDGNVRALSEKLKDYDADAGAKKPFEQAIQQAAALNPEEKLHAARALAAERIVLSALGNMYRRMETPTPEERFTDYFTRALKGTPEKPATQQEQKAFIETLKKASEKMIISVVQTMHPTIYHTDFARRYETEITTELEGIAAGLLNTTKEARLASTADQMETLLREVKRKIHTMTDDLMAGKESVTPDKQVKVVDENILDRFNHNRMKDAFKKVVSAYNNALVSVANALQTDDRHPLNAGLAGQMRDSRINDSQVIWRTWAHGADADGRDSTSILLYDGIHHHVRDGKYIGRKRDLRENAKDQKQSVSCLIQKAHWRDGDFRDFCNEFLTAHGENAKDRIQWKDADDSTALQMSEQEQADMYKALITGRFGSYAEKLADLRLVPPSLNDQTIAFNRMFRKVYREFLLEKKDIVAEGKPLPDLNTLDKEDLQELARRIKETTVECGPKRERVRFTLDINGNGDHKENGESNGKENGESNGKKDISPPSLLYSPTTGDNKGFFEFVQKTVITKDAGGRRHAELSPLLPKERRKLLDVVKRLQVLNDAHDTFGDKVADRYQVANFENASDFYASLLLFKETGIIKVKDGKVEGKPKLSLQPLLEKEQDQTNAPSLFRGLLRDDLVRSYYEALGHADIMVGYSDGAKSAGNLASEWSIYKCERNLKEEFKKAGIKVRVNGKDEDIELRFFHGRGRGDSRGGQFDEGQNYRASAPELHQDMRYDETIQSDGPMNGAISKSRSEDMLTSMITGVITAKRESDVEMEKRKDPAYVDRVKARERAIDTIAKTSKDGYLELVAKRPETMKLLNAVHDNIFKSSRAKSRGKTFDDERAISVEYGFNMADAPLHYIGTQTALKDFIKSGQTVPDEQGHQVSGARALEVLYQTTPFIRNLLDKTEQGLRDYDPAVFQQYAKVAGVDDWAKECITELSGLKDLVHDVRTQEATKQAMRTMDRASPERPRPLAGKLPLREVVRRGLRQQRYEERGYEALRAQNVANDKMAHALGVSGAYANGEIQSIEELCHNPQQPEDANSTEAKTMRILSFLASESNRGKGLFPDPAITAAVDHVPYLARAR
jgi:phosphoenolpyruvate carboxylase